MFQVADEHECYRAVNLVALCLETGELVRLPEPSILRNDAGEEYAIRASAAPIHDQQMRVVGVVIAFSNITETRRLTEQMRYQANHDALTHLPNLDLLRDRLKHAIARAGAVRAWRCCSSTWISSRRSTKGWVTVPVMPCCGPSLTGCCSVAARTTPSSASAVTNSSACSRTCIRKTGW